MKVHAKLAIVAAAALAAAVLVGCSRNADPAQAEIPSSSTDLSPSPQSSARPTLTEAKLQPPANHNEYATQGRLQVVFDPCTWISDSSVSKAGLDPATRRRGDDLVAEYTFLTCDFKGPLRDLQINSGNVAWDEDLQKNAAHSEPITVNGREGLLVQDPQLRRVCSIHVRTKVGFVMFSSTRTFEGSEAGLGLCDGVLEIATALEPEIGEGN